MDLSWTTISAVAALGFAPGLFWLWYIARKDKWEPEPARYVIAMFFWGMLSTIPPLLIGIVPRLVASPHPIDFPLSATVLAPFTEESSKFLLLWLALKFFKGLGEEFDEPMDGIIYSAAVALGFASLENAAYMVGAYLQGDLLELFATRALMSVPGHLLFSTIWGYSLGMSRFKGKKGQRGAMTVVSGLALAILFHGVFNTIAIFSSGAALGFLALLVVGFWFVLRRNIRIALDRSPFKRDS